MYKASIRQCTCAHPHAPAAGTLKGRQRYATESALQHHDNVSAFGTSRQPLPRQPPRRRRCSMTTQAASDAPAAFANSELSERDSLKTQLIRYIGVLRAVLQPSYVHCTAC
jgi:hypothetical protein